MTPPDTAGYEAEPTDVAAETAWLGEFTDPLERYARASSAQAHHEAVVAALSRERADAALELYRDVGSYGKVADLIGCSRGRAQQLIERARDRA